MCVAVWRRSPMAKRPLHRPWSRSMRKSKRQFGSPNRVKAEGRPIVVVQLYTILLVGFCVVVSQIQEIWFLGDKKNIWRLFVDDSDNFWIICGLLYNYHCLITHVLMKLDLWELDFKIPGKGACFFTGIERVWKAHDVLVRQITITIYYSIRYYKYY